MTSIGKRIPLKLSMSNRQVFGHHSLPDQNNSSANATEPAGALCPGVQTVNAHPQTLRYFARRVSTLRHLLDRGDLELFCVPLSTSTFSLCPELWLRSVYDCRNNSITDLYDNGFWCKPAAGLE